VGESRITVLKVVVIEIPEILKVGRNALKLTSCHELCFTRSDKSLNTTVRTYHAHQFIFSLSF